MFTTEVLIIAVSMDRKPWKEPSLDTDIICGVIMEQNHQHPITNHPTSRSVSQHVEPWVIMRMSACLMPRYLSRLGETP
ncbi:hypothetical protein [Vulcanisaeta moutnovskia]|uniref:hypothetical protein n=1 Tax=Vulcanisaeta moutnovskia TaxID=985052 RepID=UPI000A89BDD1|nr:hypothetical protein [Vulcanisaeta moutnovskia]